MKILTNIIIVLIYLAVFILTMRLFGVWAFWFWIIFIIAKLAEMDEKLEY